MVPLHLVYFHDSVMISSMAWGPTVRDQMICFLFPWGEPHFACMKKQTFLLDQKATYCFGETSNRHWYKLLTSVDGLPYDHEQFSPCRNPVRHLFMSHVYEVLLYCVKTSWANWLFFKDLYPPKIHCRMLSLLKWLQWKFSLDYLWELSWCYPPIPLQARISANGNVFIILYST